jgi:hypothetical protein
MQKMVVVAVLLTASAVSAAPGRNSNFGKVRVANHKVQTNSSWRHIIGQLELVNRNQWVRRELRQTRKSVVLGESLVANTRSPGFGTLQQLVMTDRGLRLRFLQGTHTQPVNGHASFTPANPERFGSAPVRLSRFGIPLLREPLAKGHWDHLSPPAINSAVRPYKVNAGMIEPERPFW